MIRKLRLDNNKIIRVKNLINIYFIRIYNNYNIYNNHNSYYIHNIHSFDILDLDNIVEICNKGF